MNPQATIVVTAFDRLNSLQRLLKALCVQSLSPDHYEVIIADDSAALNTGEKARAAVQTPYPTTLVRTDLPYEVNGVSVARNLGIQAAKGRVVISIDDDCIPNRYFVEEHLKYHQNGYPVIVLGHRSEKIEKLGEDRPVSVTERKALSELIGGASDFLGFGNFMTGNISFPKDMITRAGLFNETFAQPGEHGWEDIEMGYRLWRQGYPTVFSRNALVYRPATEKEKDDQRRQTGAIRKALDRFLALHATLPWINQFQDAWNRSEAEPCLEIGKKILDQDPENVGVLIRVASLHLKNSRSVGAEQCLSRATALHPMNAWAQELYGETLFHLRQHGKALNRFRMALDLDPLRTRSLYFLAHLKEACRTAGLESLGSRKIHVELGGGILPTKIRAEGQDDFINVDIQALPSVDVVRDLRQPLPFPDRSVNRIFSREMIEHLPHAALPGFLAECFRILEPGGTVYLCSPDFEAIMALYDKQCGCVSKGVARPDCPRCRGQAIISEGYWRSNLLGDQQNCGDGGHIDTHKNQITFPYLKSLLEQAGFVDIQRDSSNRFYEEHKKKIKLSVRCIKPWRNG
jgi:GT2 family glycosyltransferase